ncbi:MAG: biliverdin-producing heme oxygenase [Roseobacter sp.]
MSVRDYVAAQTQNLHEALHHDPVLERLTSPNVTPNEYRLALTVLSDFYLSVEQNRQLLGKWAEFDLQNECDAIRRDLGHRKVELVELKVTGSAELLGMLYVAHGASFGRNVFRRNLRRTFPKMPLFFVCQPVDKSKWRLLIDTMEQHGKNPQDMNGLLNGARRGFEIVAGLSAAILCVGDRV